MTPPNVVLVVLDTARARNVDRRTMPTLSALSREGTAFTRSFSAAPWTVPSHASLFTGTYPSRHGTTGAVPVLGEELRTIAECFADAGYETVGVSNNTWITEEFGFDRGFERLRKGWQYVQSDTDMGAVVRAKTLRAKVTAARKRLFDGNPLVNAANVYYTEVRQPGGDDGAARTTDWVEGWLADRDDDRPFFCFVNYLEAHVVYRPPRAYAEPFLPDDVSYERAIEIKQSPRAYDVGEYDLTSRDFEILRGLYRGELAYLDDHLARLRDALVAANMWEDTVFVVCGDHGENVGDHDLFGHQYALYDTLLHVPLSIHGGPFTGGGRRDELVQLHDLSPALLDVAGIEDATFESQHQGRSLHPEVATEPREAVYAEYLAPQPSMETLEERFGHVPERVRRYDRSLRAIRTDREKYVRGSDGSREYYCVDSDPGEWRDRAEDAPNRIRALDERLQRWRHSFEHASRHNEAVTMTEGTRARLVELGYL